MRTSSVNLNAARLFVITGGPGSGKTSLLDAFERRGYARSVEAGRAIIQDQVSIGGPALPWKDRALFAEMMLAWEMLSYRMAEQANGPVMFDRGVPDVLGYLRLVELPVAEHLQNAAEKFRYHHRVFIAPPWREIFQQDRERKQDFDEAVRTYRAIASVYGDLGYELVELPCVPLEQRVEFVIRHIGSALPAVDSVD